MEPYVGGSGDVVIPKQDTLLCIADRSLSRLRGSPLPGAGCWGPVTCVGAFILLYADVQVLSFASARLFCRVLLRRLCRRGALGWLCRLSLGGRLALVLRWRVCPAGCCCGGFAAGALLGWLCRLGLGWVLGRVDVLRIRRTSLLFFPLQTIAPSLRGLPAPAGWGSHNPRAVYANTGLWGDFGILHGPFRRNAACFFLYTPILVNAWGDFGISEYPHGPFRRNAARTFPVFTSTGNHLGRFWNIGMSARTFQENVPVHSMQKWRHYFVQHAYYMKTAPEAGRSCTFLFGSLTSP